MSRLIDHFPSWMEEGGGIFEYLEDVPWDGDELINVQAMDIEYFGNRSGLKNSSPIVEKLTAFPDDHELNDEKKTMLAYLIAQKFYPSWSRVYQALLVNYEPLDNYNMEETRTPGATKKTAVATDSTITNGSTGSIYAFNSGTTTPAPATGATGTSTTQGLPAKNYTEESYTGYDTLTRKGNIGVTTSQQMLQAELDVRRQTFLEIVYRDTDTILTRPSWE